MKQPYIFYVYILKCSDASYYVGVTNDLDKRISEHNNKVGSKYVSKRLPFELVYYDVFNDIRLAIDFEKQLKGWSRKKKEALISNDIGLLKRLANVRKDKE